MIQRLTSQNREARSGGRVRLSKGKRIMISEILPLLNASRGLFLCVAMLSLACPAFAASRYTCVSAETDPAVPSPLLPKCTTARMSRTFASPSLRPTRRRLFTQMSPDDATESGPDFVAFSTDGISVVIYPDPAKFSTVVFGDAGGTQVSLAMHCKDA